MSLKPCLLTCGPGPPAGRVYMPPAGAAWLPSPTLLFVARQPRSTRAPHQSSLRIQRTRPRDQSRRRRQQEEEVAVGVRVLPRRQGPAHPWADWLGGNTNGLDDTVNSLYEWDQATIITLEKEKMVDPNKLQSYLTPDVLLNQGDKINPVNVRITGRINDMARGRRTLLPMKVTKKKNVAESTKIAKDLSKWPVEVQELQGEVTALKGRYVRLPYILVTKVSLL